MVCSAQIVSPAARAQTLMDPLMKSLEKSNSGEIVTLKGFRFFFFFLSVYDPEEFIKERSKDKVL